MLVCVAAGGPGQRVSGGAAGGRQQGSPLAADGCHVSVARGAHRELPAEGCHVRGVGAGPAVERCHVRASYGRDVFTDMRLRTKEILGQQNIFRSMPQGRPSPDY